MPLDLTSNLLSIKKIQIYENEKQFFFIGTHNVNRTSLIFTINKIRYPDNNNFSDLELENILVEHKKEYDGNALHDLVHALSKDQATRLRPVEEDIKAIYGFFKFYFGYYCLAITEYSQIGKIGDHIINRVEKTKFIPMFTVHGNNPNYEAEHRYLQIMKSFEMVKQTYFSYTYNLTKTLQRNFIENFKGDVIKNYNENFQVRKDLNVEYDIKKVTTNCFLWNHFHIKKFFNMLENKIWIVFFIYGFFEQIECRIYGLRFLISVISRRNRHYAGTRYLKRGISDDGTVANDVETEQILQEISTSCSDKPVVSSYIHIRGSVPIHWYQEQNSILPKPDIKVNYSDVFFDVTKRHFSGLIKRYGSPIIACNLTKMKEEHKQELLLNESYQSAVEYIKSQLNEPEERESIVYHHYDLKTERRKAKFYSKFYGISYNLIEKTNMFAFVPYLRCNNTYLLILQNGVIRSNCVDCLDRTNVFQQVIGTAVMVNQLRNFGISAKEPNNEDDEMFGILTELYRHMGHEISTQYAGSLAHKQTIKDKRSGMDKIIDKIPELFNTAKRYFNNSFNDQYKQAGINLFLGAYRINFNGGKKLPHLWDLTSDNILHKKPNLQKLNSDWNSSANGYYKNFYLIDDIVDNLIPEEFVKRDILDSIKLTRIKQNHFLVNIERFKKKKTKNFKDFVPFCLLDIDHKTQIKNFFTYSYDTKYDENTNAKNFDTILSPENFLNPGTHTKENTLRSMKSKTKFLKKEKSLTKFEGEGYNNDKTVVEKPKFDAKFTFEFDENEINLINEFVDPDPKYLQNSEYTQTDYFANIPLNNETSFSNVFDNENFSEDLKFYEKYHKNEFNDFVEDFNNRFNNNIPKKNEKKYFVQHEKDYLIYVVSEGQFYKNIVQEASFKNGAVLTDSPKVKVKVKRIPMRIIENHYD
jgi:hypothetical protein